MYISKEKRKEIRQADEAFLISQRIDIKGESRSKIGHVNDSKCRMQRLRLPFLPTHWL